MIDKSAAVTTVMARLKKMPDGTSLEMLTYKRDRSVVIAKQEGGRFLVTEKGFAHEVFTVAAEKLPKLLKGLLKREFPRSNKIRLACREDGNGKC